MSQAATNDELIEDCQTFLKRYYDQDVMELAERYPREQGSLTIDWMDLFSFQTSLAEDLIDQPDQIIDYLEEGLRLYDLPVDVDLSGASIRVTNPLREPLSVADTRSRHVGNYVAINGLVKKASDVHPRLIEAAFECQRCGTLAYIPQSGAYQEPHECKGCERQGPFTLNYDQSSYVDHQAIRLQEPPEQTRGGEGAHIDVDLEGDLVGRVTAGDRVDFSGIQRVQVRTKNKKKTRDLDQFLEGKAVEFQESDYEEIDVEPHLDAIDAIASGDRGDPFDLLVDSLAGGIFGMDDVKKALVLQMFGGVREAHDDGTSDRGDSHVLLIGDPGAAKSELLRAVSNLAPRSVFAEGKGLSPAGATAAAVRDDFGPTEWGLEAGAIVLANGGVACIDELDKVNEDTVSSLHGALEQQIVEVNKAGIDATLPAQTAVLAAANPIYGRFDPYEPIPEQIDLEPTLVSRFDLIFTVTDKPDKERDRDLAEHVLETRSEGVDPPVDRDLFRAYIAHAKQSYQPSIESEAVRDEIVDFYVTLRTAYEAQEDSPVPVTARKLKAIVRLAQASARVRLSQVVEHEDVERATGLVQATLRDVGIDPETGQFDADVVETGASKTQRDRIKSVRNLIAELVEENAEGAPIEVLKDRADDLGIDESKVDHEVEKLRQRGEVYEPTQGYLRLT